MKIERHDKYEVIHESIKRLNTLLSRTNGYFCIKCGSELKTSKSNAYEATMPPNLQVRYVAELLEPISSRILCMVDGNHEARTKRDVDVSLTHWIALELGLADVWRPSVAFLYVDLGNAGGIRIETSDYKTSTKYCLGTVTNDD